MTAKKAAAVPNPIRVCFQMGAVTMETEVPALKVEATIAAMAKVYRAVSKRHPEVLPELGSVCSSMLVEANDEEIYDAYGKRRVGFR